ncbi:MAG: N-acetylmuramoyl-L-alanine amidase [Verrucomicrobiota bacterium]
MTRLLYPFFGLGMLALLAACAGPVTSSSGHDSWGHRPGPRGFTTVIIDAGHGGKDSGATSKSTSQQEKDLTLDMAKRLSAELSASFHTILMRSDDTFVALDERVARANHSGDAILISMHFNSGPQHMRGPETYYWRVDSHGLAVRLQRAMVQACPAEHPNRGLVRRRLRLTRNPEIPCVLLEGGYLSHPVQARLIRTPGYRQRLAAAIAGAIRTQAAIGDTGTGPLPPPLSEPPSRGRDRRQ